MNDTPTSQPSTSRPTADRSPTADEERAADEAAKDVDLDEVAEHYQEMAEKGANVKGEGQIEPD